MHPSRFNILVVQRECIPFPGPPEEKELAEPNIIRRILYNSMWWLLEAAPSKATAKSNTGWSVGTLSKPPIYFEGVIIG